MVLFSGATSSFRKGGLTTRGGSSTVDLLNGEAPPTTTNQKKGWFSNAWDWVSNHSEGLGRGLSAAASAGAWGYDLYQKSKGNNDSKALETLNKFRGELGKYVDKNETNPFGKLVKGFALKDSGKLPAIEKEEKEVKKESNGHVPTGYDKIKPYYISPSVGGRNYNQLSQAVANEWRRYKQQNMKPIELTDKQKQKAWKKWKKWKKGKKGKKGKKDKSKGGNPPKSKGGNPKP